MPDAISAQLSRPDLFLGQVPPRLHELSLRNCTPFSTSILFQAPLTYLQLVDCRVWDTVKGLLKTLEQLPMLQHLNLSGSLPMIHEPALEGIIINHSNDVHLNDLRSLTLVDSATGLLTFLEYVHFPCHTIIHVLFGWESLLSGYRGLSRAASLLSAHFAPVIDAGLSFDELLIDGRFDWFSGPDIHISARPIKMADNRKADSAALASRVFVGSSWNQLGYAVFNRGHVEPVFIQACRTLPAPLTNAVHTLRARDQFFLAHPPVWFCAFQHLANLRTIEVTCFSACGLVAAFALHGASGSPSDGDGHESLLFGNLTTRHISLVSFTSWPEQFHKDGFLSPHLRATSFFDVLLAESKKRVRLGRPWRLVIRASKVTAKMVQTLREVSGEGSIRWDEKTDVAEAPWRVLP